MPPPSGYRYYRTLTDSAGTSLAGFACRVDLAAAGFSFAHAQADGSDLRVYDATGDVTLPYWLEDFDQIAGKGRLWYRAVATGNFHRLYYGNPAAASASSFAGVFDHGSGFDADWGDLATSVTGGGQAARLAASAGLDDVRYRRVFRRSTVPAVGTGQWPNRACVREFSLLTDPYGVIVQDGGVYVAYYINQNTLDNVNYPGQTARCTSADLVAWGNHTLALAAGEAGTYDDRAARVATAQKWGPGDYRMWYSANSSVAGLGGVGYATSTDGITWTRGGNILTNANCGITDVTPVFLSGVPDVLRLLDGSHAMLCESRGGAASGYPWKVYGWTSPNGLPPWTVLNGGAPLIGTVNGISTWGCANPHLWQRAANDFRIFSQAFSGSSGDLTTFNGLPSWFTASALAGPYTADPGGAVAGRIFQTPSNFGVETSGIGLVPGTGEPIIHLQDYPAPDNLNTVSNVYRAYPALSRCGLLNASRDPADAALASVVVSASGTFAAENRCTLTTHRSGDNTIYQLALADSATAFVPDTSTNNSPRIRVAIRQNTFSSGQATGSTAGPPGDLSFLYWDGAGAIHYYSGAGAAWGTATNASANTSPVDTLRELVLRIDDDGTSYRLSATYADDGSAVPGASALIAKSAVKAFSLGRALFSGVPYTNTNYGAAYSRRISVRPYAATEPALTPGVEVDTSPQVPSGPTGYRLLESGASRLLESSAFRLLESASGVAVPGTSGYRLLESGASRLLESGAHRLLESGSGVVVPPTPGTGYPDPLAATATTDLDPFGAPSVLA